MRTDKNYLNMFIAIKERLFFKWKKNKQIYELSDEQCNLPNLKKIEFNVNWT